MSERLDPNAAAEGESEPLSELDALTEAGDVEGLLRLARAHRSGDGATKDLRACMRAYQAAAELGSAEAHNAVALFYLAGGIVPQDIKTGVSHLRKAADLGHVPADVYIANLYELGVHYGKDTQKADVWYRKVARGVGITHAPSTPEFDRAMAEQGSVRHLLLLREAGAIDEATDQQLTRKVMQLGLKLAQKRDSDPGDRVSVFGDGTPAPGTLAAVSRGPSAPGAANATANASAAASTAPGAKTAEKPAPKSPSRLTLKAGLGGFFYALLFFAVAAGAGYALMHGALVLLQTRPSLPLIGTRAYLIFPAALVVLGFLPTLFVYRANAVARSLLASAVSFGIGWAVWGTGSGAILSSRMTQAGATALAGYLAALLLFGLFGGTKKADPKAKI